MLTSKCAVLGLVMTLLTSPALAQEAHIGSPESFPGAPTKATHVLQGHKYPVRAVAISPDMKTITSGGGENKLPTGGKPGQTITLAVKDLRPLTRGEAMTWDVKSAKRKASLQTPPGNVVGLSFNHDGKVIGGWLVPPFGPDQPELPTVVFWEASKGKAVNQYVGLKSPHCFSFSPDNKFFVVAGGFRDPDLITTGPFGQNALVQDPKHGNVIRVIQYPAMTLRRQIDISEKISLPTLRNMCANSRFVAYHLDQKIHVVNFETGQESLVIPDSDGGAMRFSPDGKVLAVLGENRGERHSLQLFSLENGEAIGDPAFVVSTGTKAFAFSADSKRLAIATGWAGDESPICLWSIAERKEVARYVGHVGGVNSIAFSSDGSFLVSGGFDKTVRIWKLPPE